MTSEQKREYNRSYWQRYRAQNADKIRAYSRAAYHRRKLARGLESRRLSVGDIATEETVKCPWSRLALAIIKQAESDHCHKDAVRIAKATIGTLPNVSLGSFVL